MAERALRGCRGCGRRPRDPVRRPRRVAGREVHRRRAARHAVDPHGEPAVAGRRWRRGHRAARPASAPCARSRTVRRSSRAGRPRRPDRRAAQPRPERPPMPAPLVPDDDLYARLEVGLDASPEAIELAWRALLKRHHPDVAGDGADAARARQADQRRPRLAGRPGPARPVRRGAAGLARSGGAAVASAARRAADASRTRRGAASRRARLPRAPAAPSRPDLVPRRPGRAPRPVPRPRRAPDARRAGPPRRRRAAADRVPRHRPAVPAARRAGRVRRGGGGARRRESRTSAGPRPACARGCSASRRSSCWRRSSTIPSRSRSAAARGSGCCEPGTPRWTSLAMGPNGEAVIALRARAGRAHPAAAGGVPAGVAGRGLG